MGMETCQENTWTPRPSCAHACSFLVSAIDSDKCTRSTASGMEAKLGSHTISVYRYSILICSDQHIQITVFINV